MDSTPDVGCRFVFEVPLLTSASVPSTVPLAGRAISLLAALGPWRTELERRLAGWGAQVKACAAAAEQAWPVLVPGTTVVMFEPAPEERRWAVQGGHAWVEVSRDGPLRPQPVDGGWAVSCYASQALCEAVKAVAVAPSQNLPAIDAIG